MNSVRTENVMTGTRYGTVGMIGVGASLLALSALHILDPDLSVVDQYISEYALGDYGWLSVAANFGLGAGVIAIALGLRDTLAASRRARASWILVLVAGVGFIVSGVFPTDRPGGETTTAGAVHDIGGYVSLLGLLISAWMLRGVFARDDAYRFFARTQMAFAVLLTLAFAGVFLLFELSVGLPQRAFLLVTLIWLFVLSLTIVKVVRTQHGAIPELSPGTPI